MDHLQAQARIYEILGKYEDAIRYVELQIKYLEEEWNITEGADVDVLFCHLFLALVVHRKQRRAGHKGGCDKQHQNNQQYLLHALHALAVPVLSAALTAVVVMVMMMAPAVLTRVALLRGGRLLFVARLFLFRQLRP